MPNPPPARPSALHVDVCLELDLQAQHTLRARRSWDGANSWTNPHRTCLRCTAASQSRTSQRIGGATCSTPWRRRPRAMGSSSSGPLEARSTVTRSHSARPWSRLASGGPQRGGITRGGGAAGRLDPRPGREGARRCQGAPRAHPRTRPGATRSCRQRGPARSRGRGRAARMCAASRRDASRGSIVRSSRRRCGGPLEEAETHLADLDGAGLDGPACGVAPTAAASCTRRRSPSRRRATSRRWSAGHRHRPSDGAGRRGPRVAATSGAAAST